MDSSSGVKVRHHCKYGRQDGGFREAFGCVFTTYLQWSVLHPKQEIFMKRGLEETPTLFLQPNKSRNRHGGDQSLKAALGVLR